ncbi:DedA family protein [Nitriliruptor alkaliphilus]|uniref:DedA family protein n=1 Tax=Nitriliruptor alkaliphilus TaxID=427918 RepID=UPI000698B3A6|nr:VTT domain-containing protein [Nitriliruptor alkaliphilus]
MSDTSPTSGPSDGGGPRLPEPDELVGRRIPDAVRRTVVTLAVLRYVIPIAAIAAVPSLIANRQITLLVALRPGKEILLLAGGRLRLDGEPSMLLLFVAAFPLYVAAVWAFFVLGRAYQVALRTGEGPEWLHRALPPERLEVAQRALARRGPVIAFVGRVGGLPPTILAAAAGVSDVRARGYLLADGVGAVIAFTMTVGIGYALGEAYERAGVWFTVSAVVLVFALATWFQRWVQRELDREGAA